MFRILNPYAWLRKRKAKRAAALKAKAEAEAAALKTAEDDRKRRFYTDHLSNVTSINSRRGLNAQDAVAQLRETGKQ